MYYIYSYGFPKYFLFGVFLNKSFSNDDLMRSQQRFIVLFRNCNPDSLETKSIKPKCSCSCTLLCPCVCSCIPLYALVCSCMLSVLLLCTPLCLLKHLELLIHWTLKSRRMFVFKIIHTSYYQIIYTVYKMYILIYLMKYIDIK